MKSTEFIIAIEKFKKRIIFINVVWAIIVIVLIGLLYLQKTENINKEVLVISDNGRFIAKQSPEDDIYKFDVKNFTKVLLTQVLEYDKGRYDESIKELRNLVSESSFKEIEKYLVVNNTKKVISDQSVYIKVDIDSIKINDVGNNISVIAYTIQNIIKDSELVKINPVAVSFEIEKQYKTENNPYGILANNLNLFKYNIMNLGLLSEEQLNTLQLDTIQQ